MKLGELLEYIYVDNVVICTIDGSDIIQGDPSEVGSFVCPDLGFDNEPISIFNVLGITIDDSGNLCITIDAAYYNEEEEY